MESGKNLVNKFRTSLNSELIRAFIILEILFIAVLTLIPSPILSFELREKVNIYLTLNITLFAFIEGYSTWVQSVQFDKRNRIEDLRNELEKAYGPLYSILNQVRRIEPLPEPWGIDPKDKRVHLVGTEKDDIDAIFGKYPFMFDPESYSFWQEVIQNPKRDIAPRRGEFWIPLAFVDMFNEEYGRRLNEYNSLIGKPDRG